MNLIPAKNYTPPDIPTLDTIRADPAPLKRLPSRWQKNAAAAVCIGLMGTTVLTSCFPLALLLHGGGAGGGPIYTPRPTPQEVAGMNWNQIGVERDDLVLHKHVSEAGRIWYTARLTDSEAFNTVKAYLTFAGLTLDMDTPDYFVHVQDHQIYLDLYDAERGIAVAFIGWDSIHTDTVRLEDIVANVAFEFSKIADINVLGIANPRISIWSPDVDKKTGLVTESEIARARMILEDQLTSHILQHVGQLIRAGLLER
jgi:hypothetical protein